jgi:hypothetical protein
VSAALVFGVAGCPPGPPDDQDGGIGGNAPTGGSGIGGSAMGGGADSGGFAGQGGAAGSCDHPVDEAMLTRLYLAGSIVVEPGDTHWLSYLLNDTPIPTCTEWSMTPTAGATLDPASGLLTIDPATPGGTVYAVTGNLENKRHVESVNVYVVTQLSHPIIGIWREVARYDCVTGAEVPANPNPIGEIRFDADGRLAVTWVPFETYYDYWANYTLDLDAGTMEATIDHGNYVPQDTDLFGSFHIDAAKDLVLRDVWFGTAKVSTATAACGHRLTGGRWK